MVIIDLEGGTLGLRLNPSFFTIEIRTSKLTYLDGNHQSLM
jgi:hypothetical protein